MVYENVLAAVGHTPMIRLNRIPDKDCAEILVKFEGLNIGGSIKTRTALNMILAAILAGGNIGTHLQMGIGDGIIPDILDRDIYDNIYVVSDDEAIGMARRLAREEGIMCGISSGTNVAAALQLARKLGPGKTVVTVLPDTAERYFSTPLFDE